MNFYDSDRMADMMTKSGFEISDTFEDSDLVVLNTCHIREKAAEKVYSELGRIRKEKTKMKEQGRAMIIAVAGCVAQAEGKEMLRRAPFVDIVVGPQAYQRLPELVNNAHKSKGLVELDFSVDEKFDILPEESSVKSASAFLTIQEGCDKFCTYCVVPYTRGAEYSRSVNEIYREAIRLVSLGAREITLLGQNVNAYHGRGVNGKDSSTMGDLIRHLSAIEGLERIRYTTSYPSDMDDDLISVHGEVEKLMPFLHLPVQSGSDRILKAMNRRHTADEYLKIIDKLRKSCPKIEFSSDFIVGFPGETDKDFEDTIKLIEEVGFVQSYSFTYSPRPGTPAATMEGQIPKQIKSERLAILQNIINKQQVAFNKSTIGLTMPTLFERKGKSEGQYIGKSPYMQSVYVDSPHDLTGKIIDVHIDGAFANSVSGTLVND